MPNAPAPFVTWECKNGNNYFLGHYFSSRREAEQDLLERAGRELEYQSRGQEQPEKKKKERER